jgi:hypothetical protein
MAQGFGYLLASLGPIGIGAIHAASGNWTVPLIALAVLLVPQLIAGTIASREGHVLARHKHTASPGRPAAPRGDPPAPQHRGGRHARHTARLIRTYVRLDRDRLGPLTFALVRVVMDARVNRREMPLG